MAEFSRTTITVNGQTYNSVDDMPPDVRRQYEQVMSLMADKNNNGVPDIMEGHGGDAKTAVVTHVTTTTHDLTGGGTMPRQMLSAASSQVQRPHSGGGVTIRVTWPTLLALLVVAALVLTWLWATRG